MSVLYKDIENVAKYLNDLDIRKSTFLITGATGLIGSFLIKSILACNKKRGIENKVIAIVRNRAKAEQVFGEELANPYLKFVYRDIIELEEITDNIDYIIHAASITNSKELNDKPVEVIDTSLFGTKKVLSIAKNHNVKAMVFLSSVEVYGVIENDKPISEEDMGYINHLKPRSSYSESKRMAECLCSAYANEYNLNVIIARLTQTFGSGINGTDNRIFAQIARSVVDGQDIVLHTTGLSSKCYCYITDAVKAIFLLLSKGLKGEAYNIANPETYISIRDMAYMVSEQIANKSISVRFDIPKNISEYGYAPDTKVQMNCIKLISLGWSPEFDLKSMFERTIKYFEEQSF